MQNIPHFAKKKSQATLSKEIVGKFSTKKKPYLKEKTYGTDKILGGF